jgi:hypothetical protein
MYYYNIDYLDINKIKELVYDNNCFNTNLSIIIKLSSKKDITYYLINLYEKQLLNGLTFSFLPLNLIYLINYTNIYCYKLIDLLLKIVEDSFNIGNI